MMTSVIICFYFILFSTTNIQVDVVEYLAATATKTITNANNYNNEDNNDDNDNALNALLEASKFFLSKIVVIDCSRNHTSFE